jgi:SAM-dependent methyltransferase
MKRLVLWFFVSLLVFACGGAPPPAESPAESPPAEHGNGHGHGHGHGHGGEHRFDDPEKWSKVFDDPKRDEWQKPDELLRELKLAPDAVVADLGAGTGYFSVRLARAVPQGRVIAIDIEQRLLEHIARRASEAKLANIETVLASPDDPKLPSPVDLVLIVDTYHHIDQRVGYFTKLGSGLRPAGLVVIVDYKMGPLPVGPPDSRKIPRDKIEAEMRQAGYRLCRSWDGLPYQHVLFFGVQCG